MTALARFARASLTAASVLLALGPAPRAADVTIPASHDNTLFQDNGSRSCGMGPLFGGQTLSFGSRRIVLSFSLAGSIPPGSTITSAELEIFIQGVAPSSQVTDVYSLHRLQADWGEQGSACTRGSGAAAQPGDATWTHRHYPTLAWSVAGGDFDATASGSVAMPTASVLATFPSQPGMVADVQSWLNLPSANFGWIILGDEASPANAREFYSREILPPALHVSFTAPPGPPPAVPDGAVGSPVLLSKLSADGADLLVSWDTALCDGDVDHHLVFGIGSGFPSALSDPYVLQGSVCDLGASSPFAWSASPDPAVLDPGTRVIWMLVLASDGGSTEGSWGRSNPLQERNGPGPGGCSNQCGILSKNVTNACGTGF